MADEYRKKPSLLSTDIQAMNMFGTKPVAFRHKSIYNRRGHNGEDETHEITEKSELVGSTVSQGYAIARSLPTAYQSFVAAQSKNPNSFESFKTGWDTLWDDVEHRGGVNIHLFGASALAYTLATGETGEQKAMGASVWAREIVADKFAKKFANFVTHQTVVPVAERFASQVGLASHLVASISVSRLLAPYFDWGAAKVGRMLDFKHSTTAEDAQAQASYSPQHNDAPSFASSVGSTRVIPGKQMERATKGSTKIKTRLSDQRISHRDIDEAEARKLAYGRAF